VGVVAVAIGAGASKDKARKADLVEVDAEIYSIDRTCRFDVSENDSTTGRKTVKSESDDCSSHPDFAKFKNPKTRPYKVDGKAAFKLIYKSPVDGSSQTGVVDYDGGDEEFYSFNADDKIRIRVSKSDPSVIEKITVQG
jgi:hypothetical protein